jgi:hypothetical protein
MYIHYNVTTALLRRGKLLSQRVTREETMMCFKARALLVHVMLDTFIVSVSHVSSFR